MPILVSAPRRRLVTLTAAAALVVGALASGAVGSPSSRAGVPGSGADAEATRVHLSDHPVRFRAGAPLKLRAPKSAKVGSRIRLTGSAVVRAPRRAAKPRIVKITERLGGRWRVVTKTRTARSGAFAVRIPAKGKARTRTFRAEAPAVRGLRKLRTGPVRVKITAAPTVAPPGTVPNPGDYIAPEALPAGYVGALPAEDWSYLFEHGARWNPCEPIRWSYNAAGQGYGEALLDVTRAYAKISGVSGLRFQYVGTTSFRYLGEQSDAGFPKSTDMVVSWADQNEVPDLADNVVGIGGGSGYVTDTAGADVAFEITRGYLTLDKANAFPLPPGFDGSGWGQVMTHEVLHALGLGHAQTASQLMYGMAGAQNYQFGAGDISGMRKVGAAPGSSGCL